MKAEQAAQCLHSKLNNSKLFPAKQLRMECDVNRPSCQPSENTTRLEIAQKWRQQVWDWMKQQQAIWILDVHSFNSGGFGPIDHELVLLYHPPVRSSTTALIQFLQQHQVDVAPLEGSQHGYASNAIVNESWQNVPTLKDAFLLEFYEGLSSSRVQTICSLIAQFFQNNQTNGKTTIFNEAETLVNALDQQAIFTLPGMMQVDPSKKQLKLFVSIDAALLKKFCETFQFSHCL